MSQNDQDNKHSERTSRYENPYYKRPTAFERLEAVAVGGLILVGTMLTISSNHKIAAVWVFFAAYLILGVAVAVRLTGEFAEPTPKTIDKQKTAALDPTPTPTATSTPMGNTNITSQNQSGGFTGVNSGTVNLGPQPRSIPSAKRSDLVARLKQMSGSFVGLDTPMGDTEALSFANNLRRVFEEAGWEVGMTQAGWDKVPSGLYIVLHGNTDVPRHAAVLQEALLDAGFPVPARIDPSINEHSVRVIVGTKPDE